MKEKKARPRMKEKEKEVRARMKKIEKNNKDNLYAIKAYAELLMEDVLKELGHGYLVKWYLKRSKEWLHGRW